MLRDTLPYLLIFTLLFIVTGAVLASGVYNEGYRINYGISKWSWMWWRMCRVSDTML